MVNTVLMQRDSVYTHDLVTEQDSDFGLQRRLFSQRHLLLPFHRRRLLYCMLFHEPTQPTPFAYLPGSPHLLYHRSTC